MKYIWEEDDIKVGRFVCKPNPNPESKFTPCGWTVKWTSKIGYINFHTGGKDDKNYVIINIGDGRVSSGMAKEELVEYLNKEPLIPMPQDWIIATMEFLCKTNTGSY